MNHHPTSPDDLTEPSRAAAGEQLLKPRLVTQQLAVSDRTLDRLISEGELEVVRIGRQRRIKASSVARYIRRNEQP